MVTKKQVIGFLAITLTILVGVITNIIITQNDLSISIKPNTATFKVYTGVWLTVGIEKLYIDGIQLSGNISQKTLGTKTEVKRTGNVWNDVYSFDGSLKNVETFPVSHQINIKGQKGKQFKYIISSLRNVPSARSVKSGETFGYNMKVVFDPGYSSAKVTKAGTMTITYTIPSDDWTINVRLFDPPITSSNIFITSDNPAVNGTDTNFTGSFNCIGCNASNTTFWQSNNVNMQQILGLDFNVNETDNNFWDYTGNNNATCTNCPIFNSSCGADGSGCFKFNSSINQQLTLPTDMLLNFTTNNYTFSLWVFKNMSSSAIFLSTNAYNDVFYVDTSGHISFDYKNSTGQSNYVASANVTLLLENLTWHPIVIILRNNSYEFYYNGTFRGNKTLNGGIEGKARNWAIGRDSAFNGSIDNVRIYNYALTPKQIFDRYTCDSQKINCSILRAEQTAVNDVWTYNVLGYNTNGTVYTGSRNVSIWPEIGSNLSIEGNLCPTADTCIVYVDFNLVEVSR